MAMPAVDLTGQRFGYLTVLQRAGTTTGSVQCATWLCRCDCGTEVVRKSQYLRAKHRTHPRSCGCHHGNETHKLTGSPLFNVWTKMKQRCLNPNDKDWKNYGGRGVTVCDRWSESFEGFLEDMGPTYEKGLTLDRVDNNGPYAPDNCRWATVKQQSSNKRTNVCIQTPLGQMTVSQAAEQYDLKVVTLHARIFRYKWDVLRALSEPTT